MNKCDNTKQCSGVPGFGMWEKILVRGAFALGIGLGAWGIWPASPMASMGYAVFAVVGYTLLMRYTVCARCPHLLEAGDCLFVPAELTRKIISDRTGPLTFGEHGIIIVAVFGTALIPLYWLLSQPALCLAYLAVSGGWMAYLFFRVCIRCEVEVCPLRKYARKL